MREPSAAHVYVLSGGKWWRVLSCGCCVNGCYRPRIGDTPYCAKHTPP